MSLLDTVKRLFDSLINTQQSTKDQKESADKAPEPAQQVTAPPIVKIKSIDLVKEETSVAEEIIEVANEVVEAAKIVSSTTTLQTPESNTQQLPEDSALKRHYLTHLKSLDIAEQIPSVDKAVTEAVVVAEKVAPIISPAPQVVVVAVTSSKLKIPEDSALQRHFFTDLKANIEANMAARPEDSALRRHHDAAVAAEMKKIVG